SMAQLAVGSTMLGIKFDYFPIVFDCFISIPFPLLHLTHPPFRIRTDQDWNLVSESRKPRLSEKGFRIGFWLCHPAAVCQFLFGEVYEDDDVAMRPRREAAIRCMGGVAWNEQ